MKRSLLAQAAACLLIAAGCTAPGGEIEPKLVLAAATTPPPATNLWSLASAETAIRETSCDEGGAPMRGLLPLELTVAALPAKQSEAVAARLPAGAKLAGAWELTSPDPNFGGLSGLAFEDATTLLAVSDQGAWVKIGLSGGAPSGATIGYLRGADGAFLKGKSESDAEGLTVRDGIALVSFERDFRIEAFAVGTCGAGAKAVEISALPGTFGGEAIEANEGPEALSLSPSGELTFGFESTPEGRSPLGRVLASGQAEWDTRMASNPAGFALVSMDSVRLGDGSEREIFLYRAFDPLRGARSVLVWGTGETAQLTLSRPVMTDNFEGLAAQVLETGELRLWIISDNNFSNLQRTLIYAFDVPL